jgi:subtilisin family serine protease
MIMAHNQVNSELQTNLSISSELTGNMSQQVKTPAFAEDRVIVKLNPNINTSQANNFRAEIGVRKVTKAEELGIEIWQVPKGNVEKIVSTYQNDPRFEYIEPDYIINLDNSDNSTASPEDSGTITVQTTTTNDPDFSQLWGLNNTGQNGGTPDADIDAPEAWDVQTGNPDFVVGVIDSGVDYNHPDLVNNIWENPGEIAGDGIDNDGNGYIDDIRGWDFANNDNNPMDGNGHGTHVAGTIAGEGNNGIGVTGVAWNAKIMPIKFLSDSGSGSTSNAILAVNYATAEGVKVTNNSWGGGGYSQALYDAIQTAGEQGALFIAAAGNEGRNNDKIASYPANYNLPHIISVASTTNTNGLSYFSNYGATTVDLGAPGSDIYSTWPGGTYNTISGTSMATPHVTGAAVLLWSEHPTWTPQQVKDQLMQTTDKISALNGKSVSGGRLNINNALDSVPPTVSSFTPADNATDVALAANLIINFSETIQKGTGNVVIKKLSDNSVIETIDVTSANVTITNNQLTINPTANLVANTEYYVEVTDSAIEDLAGNGYAGINTNSTWNFKTGSGATSSADNLVGTANADVLDGLEGNDTISGLEGNDTLKGSAGHDSLDGGTGTDSLVGGPGNDIYTVDQIADIVTEVASQGSDLIKSSVTYTLPDNTENLTLIESSAINGTGNSLANTLTGNSANNTLTGGGGNDILIGSEGADQLLGGNGGDSVNGDAGNDSLTGGLGADKFIYNTNAAFTTASVGVDTLTDFNSAQGDKIVLDKTTFPTISSVAGTGFSVASEFSNVPPGNDLSPADILYNTATGQLFYNQNGAAAGYGTGGQFLTLTGAPALVGTNFLIQN